MKSIFLYTGIILFFSCCSSVELPPDVQKSYNELPKTISFNQDVKPILSDRCFKCHGPDKGKLEASLRLDLEESAYGELPESPGKYAVVPGNPRKSELVRRILSNDPKYVMPDPKSHLALSAKEKATLIKWIEDGAGYKPHWAFVKPEKTVPPPVKAKELVKNPIDNFILNKLEQKNLTFSPEAGREILLRRLSFDITGLPPTLQEINNFVNDKSPTAYEKQVDRLLASPHYGERMAVDWLDAARFADSQGYSIDRLRDMSPWRDWVIKAFNKNLHYDDFITWQLAGDLLPNPTKDQLIATAFNRNHQQNGEGGIVEEEFRVEYVSDRTNTMGEAFMALSVGCAKCHDHKFDPILQKDYYSLSAYFNNVKEAGQISWDNSMPVPTMLLPNPEQQKIIDYIKNIDSDSKAKFRKVQATETSRAVEWINSGAYKHFAEKINPQGMIAWYPLSKDLTNKVDKEKGQMKREGGTIEKPNFMPDGKGNVLQFSGDTWMDTKNIGKFDREDPFTISVWVNVPKELKEGVIFHQGIAGLLYDYRGFHLYVKDGKLELVMAHTAPYDAIIKYTKQDIPRDAWVNLTATYDGSGKASGYNIYLNGNEMPATVDQDNLYKGILFKRYKGIILGANFPQPAIQFGAWERGKGLAGGKMKEIKVFNRQLTPIEILQVCNNNTFAKFFSKSPLQLSLAEKNNLQLFYFATISQPYKTLQKEITAIKKEYADTLEAIPELMIMQEMPQPRKAYVLDRGRYDVHKEEVTPGVPERILPMPKEFPKNRLGLAKWLLLSDNPLTSRVAVNRYWQMFFGKGIVKSTEDFGNQGSLPSHPELLDWLAVTFRESGWDVKALVKMMVMSATYRQQSNVTEKLMAADPENIFYARGPSERLTAEMLRDNVLAVSGLLYDTIGGPSVYPYQPPGMWLINGAVYPQDSGRNVYRRSLYTVWKRSVPNPTQATFDAGIRTSCIVRRQRTNTPLQALVTLNDPTYVEAAKVMGEKITKAPDRTRAIGEIFEELAGRHPSKNEMDLLLNLADSQKKRFTADISKTKGWLSAGQYEADKTLPPALLAANTVVASTIINSDAVITKR